MPIRPVGSPSTSTTDSEELRFLSFPLPNGASIRGRVQLNSGREIFGEFVAAISLRNGITIEIGWFPPFSPQGHFVLSVYDGEWDFQMQEQWTATTEGELQLKTSFLMGYWNDRPKNPIKESEDQKMASIADSLERNAFSLTASLVMDTDLVQEQRSKRLSSPTVGSQTNDTKDYRQQVYWDAESLKRMTGARNPRLVTYASNSN
jgi:hypothetical protein